MIKKDLPTKQNPRPATYKKYQPCNASTLVVNKHLLCTIKKYQPCNASTLVVNKHLLCTINTVTAHDF